MKPNIHPTWIETTVTCACGNSFQTRSTKPALRIELCSNCHPFFTGQQRIVDTAGQVERFRRRLRAKPEIAAPAAAPEAGAEAASAPA
jgi:large subunit ribosomal protein L31